MDSAGTNARRQVLDLLKENKPDTFFGHLFRHQDRLMTWTSIASHRLLALLPRDQADELLELLGQELQRVVTGEQPDENTLGVDDGHPAHPPRHPSVIPPG